MVFYVKYCIDNENNQIKVSVGDSTLEYDSNDESIITFVNEELDCSVQNQILDSGFRQLTRNGIKIIKINN